MSKKALNIPGAYTLDTPLIVTDPLSPYTGMVGLIDRISSAGEEVIYYHLTLPNVLTVITFTPSQVAKAQLEC
jgi:hypothetical protein